MRLFDISRSSNYLSEIYRKWIWLIYLAQLISWARYIENGQEENNDHIEVPNPTAEDGEQESDGDKIDFTLSKGMHFCHSYLCNFACHIFNIFRCSHDISSKSIFDISCLSNYSSEIYQPNPFSIYLARVITRARYIKQSHFWYISLK